MAIAFMVLFFIAKETSNGTRAVMKFSAMKMYCTGGRNHSSTTVWRMNSMIAIPTQINMPTKIIVSDALELEAGGGFSIEEKVEEASKSGGSGVAMGRLTPHFMQNLELGGLM